MRSKLLSLALLVVITSIITLRCTASTDPDHAGNSSQTPNSTITGIIYQPDGTTPASGARVSIRPRATLADTTGLLKRMADTATVTTDADGRFAFDSTLDTGTYIIEADDGNNNMALIDSVSIQSDLEQPVEVSDTLLPAGSITGVIFLSEGGDVRKVFVLIFGLNRFAMPDENGVFTFDSLAEAEYDLRIVSSLDDYAVLDTFRVPVISDQVTNLDTLRIRFTGIPTVKGLALSYDTMKQIVTLTWNAVDTGLVSGYNVYRSILGQNFTRITDSPLKSSDTMFLDSDVYEGYFYEYRVVSRSNTGAESKFVDIPHDTVTVIGAYVFDFEIENETAFYDPVKMLYDSHTNQFLIVDYDLTGQSKIVVMEENGTTRSEINAAVTGLDYFQVSDLALGKDNSLIIYSSYSPSKQYIVRCSYSGFLLCSPIYIDTLLTNLPNTAFLWIMDTDSSGNIWLMNDNITWNTGWLICIDTVGNILTNWNADSLGEDVVGMHSLFYINKANNRIFLRKDTLLLEFDEKGIVQKRINTIPQYVSTDGDGYVYVLGNQIKIFDPEGKYLCRFGIVGDSGTTHINEAAGIAVGSDGKIFVLDRTAGRIKVFTRRLGALLE